MLQILQLHREGIDPLAQMRNPLPQLSTRNAWTSVIGASLRNPLGLRLLADSEEPIFLAALRQR
ncbi:hypothetical protein GCM10009625_32920 [Brachybacterium fresconis]|uniref:Uncharacterized protein n=1 Tax=Brevibacterium picturae TaxID=260553 RepID=A0ABN2CGE6_9MICO